MKNLNFRPHHFLCALSFEGKGYNRKFVKSFTEITSALRSPNGDDILIEVVEGVADNIYTACPQNNGNFCEHKSKTTPLDEAHAEILHIKIGDKLTWGEAKNCLKKYMTIEKHHQACSKCEWLKYGMCEIKLRELHNS